MILAIRWPSISIAATRTVRGGLVWLAIRAVKPVRFRWAGWRPVTVPSSSTPR